jgi:hypothetical protein
VKRLAAAFAGLSKLLKSWKMWNPTLKGVINRKEGSWCMIYLYANLR